MIKVTRLSKFIDNNLVLNNISFDIKKNKITALVGPNGAGKTTLIRCLTGIYHSECGSICYDGKNLNDDYKIKENIGFVCDESYYPFMTSIKDILSYYKMIYKNFHMDRFNYYNNIFKIDLTKKFNDLSKGMKMKLSIMISLSINADYLILDEPTSGLDPISKRDFLNLLLEYKNNKNSSILISSHHLQDLERICDDVIIMDKGKIKGVYSLDLLKNKYKKLQVAFDDVSVIDNFNYDSILHVEKEGRVATFICKDYELLKEKLLILKPLFIEELDLNLEEIFIYSLYS
ncbi:ABC transporter ATP-binding protein [Clostridium hydrogeniformans]|uniref:ABC transporter ATP-binding protein n=1 Tax=Clostridium hydrogeniformans TaxID=349933 RepID=UPI0004890ABE|nr:ABC transporter ATP-binding protein [Clostridium hydrogeniformans]